MRFLSIVGLFLLCCMAATAMATTSSSLVQADEADPTAFVEAEIVESLGTEVSVLPGNTPRVFNYQFAKDLMKLSAISSCPAANIASWNCLLCKYPATSGLKNVVVAQDAKLNTLGFIGLMPVVDNTNKQKPISSQSILIVFRGTRFDSAVNWMYNAKMDHDPFPGLAKDIKVHSGFLKDYQSLSATIIKQFNVLNKSCPNCRIVLTGHSLGGAVATLAAADLIVKGINPSRLSLYTYGSPRVGNPAFATYLNAKVTDSFRMTHANDLVVHVPPRKIGIGPLAFTEYAHVGTNYHFPNPFKFTNDKTNLQNCGITETNVNCQSKPIANVKLAISYHLTYFDIDCGCNTKTISQYKFKQLLTPAEATNDVKVTNQQYTNFVQTLSALSGVENIQSKSTEQLTQELAKIQFD